MNESVSLGQFFAVPIGQILIALLSGAWLLRRSKKVSSHLQWSFGVALISASVFAGLALLSLYVEVQNTYSFGGLIILIAPVLPLAVIGVTATLGFCACVLWGSAQGRFVTQMGFRSSPGKGLVRTSVSVLVFAGTVGTYFTLPLIHLLPYSSLTSEHRSNQVILKGIRFTGEFVPIISLETVQWPEYNPAFRLSLDWRGRVILDVWQQGTATERERTTTHYLPFRESVYRLDNGTLVAIE